MRKIITISREFGAGGSQIGTAVAERLGYYFMDKDMIIRSAVESTNLTPRDFRLYDEKVPVNVAISEAVSLTEKYALEPDIAFVNGLLGSFAKDIKKDED